MNENSRRICEQNEENKLLEIFQLLDSDGDGYISAQNIAVATVDADILQLISPVLYEMEDFSFTLTFGEFKEAVLCLFKVTNSKKASFLHKIYPSHTNN